MASFKIGGLVLRSMFGRRPTLMYPKKPRKWQERTRGQISITEEDCILCSICAKKCPTNAILVERDEGTWTIERMQCIQCNNCVEVCPKKCLFMEPKYTEPDAKKIIDIYQVPKKEKPAPKKDQEQAAPAAKPAKADKADKPAKAKKTETSSKVGKSKKDSKKKKT